MNWSFLSFAIAFAFILIVGANNESRAEVDARSDHFPLRIATDQWDGPVDGFDKPEKVQWLFKDTEGVANLLVSMQSDPGDGQNINSWMQRTIIPELLKSYSAGHDYDVVNESTGEIAPTGQSAHFQTTTFHLDINGNDRQVMFFYTDKSAGNWFWMAAMNGSRFSPFAVTDKIMDILDAVSVGK